MKHTLLALLTIVLALSCRENGQPQPFSVIPMPNDVTLSEGSFNVAGALVTVDENLDEASSKAVEAFSETLATVTGKPMTGKRGGVIRFGLNPNMGTEEYFLQVKPDGVNVEASAFGGFFYAIQTLKQMLPAEVYGNQKANAAWLLPCVTILDAPRFDYRGIHLDACRHFWSVEETKRYLDVMTAYKQNRFHWHLTEDQGWRVEIKKYPLLTEIGAWRNGTMIGKDFSSNDGIRYGGFYTQEQMREIVAYAAERGITVIPEIDLPGHMVAALSAYPELGCSGGPYEVWTRWGVDSRILCAGNENVFTFLEDVLSEIMDIFPSEYIHIGGDECFNDEACPWDSCPKCIARMRSLGIKQGPDAKHYLQNYVTARVQDFLNSKGRKIIGWDEVLQGNLTKGATVMSWRGVQGGIEAASKGFDAIMTPNSFCYFDHYQGMERDKEPLAIGGYLPLEKVYSYEPFKGIPASDQKHILGVQANLWTEYIAAEKHLEYMLMPRLCALSEVQWCQVPNKDYTRFDKSLDHTFKILDAMDFFYSLDCRGMVGLDRKPARDAAEMADYLEKNKTDW